MTTYGGGLKCVFCGLTAGHTTNCLQTNWLQDTHPSLTKDGEIRLTSYDEDGNELVVQPALLGLTLSIKNVEFTDSNMLMFIASKGNIHFWYDQLEEVWSRCTEPFIYAR